MRLAVEFELARTIRIQGIVFDLRSVWIYRLKESAAQRFRMEERWRAWIKNRHPRLYN